MQHWITVKYPAAKDTIAECGKRNESSGFYVGGGKAHFPVPSTLGPCVIGHSAIDLLASDKPGFTKAAKVWFKHDRS